MNPRAPKSDVMHVRVPKSLRERIERIAKEEVRTKNYIARELMEQGLLRRAEQQASR